MSKSEKIFVPVPQECMGIVIGTGGRNINEIKRETDTRITSCKGVNSGEESGFTVTGTVVGCEKAQLAIGNRVKKYMEDNEVKSVSPAASLSPTHSKVNDDVIKLVPVPKKYRGFVMGKERKNIEIIETKSGTKINVPFRGNAEGKLESLYIADKLFVCMLLAI
ncbi:vigilin [Paramuricea clavata]|uniref:Vigilin n=1 Tax=Paramuricea clavata TaxID=317549 RepID=A0A7D9HMN7_PARCT|nr:vigilin [Paramuricea clavata]